MKKISLKEGDPCPKPRCKGHLKEKIWFPKEDKIPGVLTCEFGHLVHEDGRVE